MWDLAIADNGDLIISGHRDLLGRSGSDLLEQRMKIRMLVQRGAWALDTTKTFGSNLRRLIGMPPETAAQAAPALVREALRGMDEIVVDEVQISYTNKDITVIAFYHTQETSGGVLVSSEEKQFAITLPVAATGSTIGEE
jgi:hypothetical protein